MGLINILTQGCWMGSFNEFHSAMRSHSPFRVYKALNFSRMSLWHCSLRQSVPCAEANGRRRRQVVRHEGAGEGQHRAEASDNGAHQDRATSSGDDPELAVPGKKSFLGANLMSQKLRVKFLLVELLFSQNLRVNISSAKKYRKMSIKVQRNSARRSFTLNFWLMKSYPGWC